jgi:hypothetical protein
MPNLIIIHLGTNDALQDFEISTAVDRLGALIDHCLAAVPNTAILVSTLIPNANNEANGFINTINAGIPAMVAERADAGELVFLVDQHAVITLTDLDSGGTHPLDGMFGDSTESETLLIWFKPEGYIKMANLWYTGIQQMFADCWFTAPVSVPGVVDTVVD